MDIATLGIAVDSSQVTKATDALNKMAPASSSAEAAARRLRDQMDSFTATPAGKIALAAEAIRKTGGATHLTVSAQGGGEKGGRSTIEVRISVDGEGNVIPSVRKIAGDEAIDVINYYDRQILPARVMKLKGDNILVRGGGNVMKKR